MKTVSIYGAFRVHKGNKSIVFKLCQAEYLESLHGIEAISVKIVS